MTYSTSGDGDAISQSATHLVAGELRSSGTFRTTCWAMVVTAGQGNSLEAGVALEQLCQLYWPPLYSYLRRSGHDKEAARDLTQQFFLKLIQQESIKQADQTRGRFRSFLLTALQNCVRDDWKLTRALKRGGGQAPLSLEAMGEHERMMAEPSDTDNPAQAFERRWAQVVLEEAARRHQQEHAQSGQSVLYDRLRGLHSLTEDTPRYALVAAEMGVPIGTLKSLVSRFRRRYREQIRLIIGETVEQPEDVEDEIRHLLHIFAR